MGFKSVYGFLVEVFPQVDLRILKAVAIEHSNDADSAAEFILSEVLTGKLSPEEKTPSPGSQKIKYLSAGDDNAGNGHVYQLEELKTSSESEGGSASYAQLGSDKHLSHEETVSEESSALKKHQVVDCTTGSYNGPDSSCITDDDDLCQKTVHTSPRASVFKLNSMEICLEENVSDFVEGLESPDMEQSVNTVECSSIMEASPTDCSDGSDKLQSEQKADVEESKFDAEMVQFSHETAGIRASHSISVDVLEERIADAYGYKETLSCEVESIMTTVNKVELQEKAADEAKVQASKAGLDILNQVEDLKNMLQRARQANDMHAGEVYGERAVLATEARELHSRLLTLSEQRNKALAVINEIHDTLKARLAAAEAEKACAEQEKFQREDSAREALNEQQLLMDSLVQDSKKLQQEADENAKLREFLMDRGRAVDILQGELARVCEDVKLLKERVDGKPPDVRGLSLNQMYVGLASSQSSHKHMGTSGSSDSARTTTQQPSNGEQLNESNGSKGGKGGDIQNMFAEDGWDFFED